MPEIPGFLQIWSYSYSANPQFLRIPYYIYIASIRLLVAWNVNCSNNNLIFWLSSKRSSSSIKESNIVTSFTVKSIRSYTASLLISDLSISISLFFNDLKRKYLSFVHFLMRKDWIIFYKIYLELRLLVVHRYLLMLSHKRKVLGTCSFI